MLGTLPLNFELPDLDVDSSGAILAEWYRSPRHLIVIKLKGDGVVHYALVADDGRRESGYVPLLGGLPKSVLANVLSIIK